MLIEKGKKQMQNLSVNRENWSYMDGYQCYILERVSYCLYPQVPAEQCMNIYVPEEYLNPDGSLTEIRHANGFTAHTVPVIFENGLAGYHEAEPFEIEDGRSAAKEFLKAGFVYVSCGCRGRSSENAEGIRCGKSPASLVDLKAGIRFLKSKRGELPGDMDRIISVGISAGGAMSTLLGCTGNSENYTEALEKMGAVMTETDDIFAAQCYCPIIDLDHADLAYEWMFRGKTHYTGMPFVGFSEGDLTPFAAALSEQLADAYVDYFNGLKLQNPKDGTLVRIGREHEGSGYEILMEKLEQSATKFLAKFEKRDALSGPRLSSQAENCAAGSQPIKSGVVEKKSVLTDFDTESYLYGNYTALCFTPEKQALEPLPGVDKHTWLGWDSHMQKARITGIEVMQETYHRRLKLCPAFDDLNLIQAENQEFGTPGCDKMHFNPILAGLIEKLQQAFPEETKQYLEGYQKVADDQELARRRYLINPMNYIGTEERADMAPHYRIRVGSRDADTSLMITLTLALKLMQTKKTDVDYEIVWDEAHGRADYPGEVTEWVKEICK